MLVPVSIRTVKYILKGMFYTFMQSGIINYSFKCKYYVFKMSFCLGHGNFSHETRLRNLNMKEDFYIVFRGKIISVFGN